MKTKSPAARALERRLAEFEAIVRAQEQAPDNRELEADYEKERRQFINILRSLVNLVEDDEPL